MYLSSETEIPAESSAIVEGLIIPEKEVLHGVGIALKNGESQQTGRYDFSGQFETEEAAYKAIVEFLDEQLSLGNTTQQEVEEFSNLKPE